MTNTRPPETPETLTLAEASELVADRAADWDPADDPCEAAWAWRTLADPDQPTPTAAFEAAAADAEAAECPELQAAVARLASAAAA